MSAGTAAAAGPPVEKKSGGLSTKAKVLIGLGTYLAIAILLGLIFGSDGKNEAFQPQNEFKLEPWVSIELGGIDLSINKAVFYLLLASALTVAAMTWIANRMAQKPNRVQTAVEVAYDLTKNNITGGNLDSARRRPAGSRSSAPSSSSSGSRTSSASCRCRPTPSTRSTSSASRSPPSPSTRPPRTSRSRSS